MIKLLSKKYLGYTFINACITLVLVLTLVWAVNDFHDYSVMVSEDVTRQNMELIDKCPCWSLSLRYLEATDKIPELHETRNWTRESVEQNLSTGNCPVFCPRPYSDLFIDRAGCEWTCGVLCGFPPNEKGLKLT